MYDPSDLYSDPILGNMSVGYSPPKDIQKISDKHAEQMGHPPSKPKPKKK